ncbi:mechanosensitive ion channel family protein [uncultured Kushneria sp.]|uniref:mechanosensitive ion channel family protein n=1 Tax=uncultured Kushneria sp. TaxID=905033 RepID=UPI00260FA95B|nr:mechanosensitive ion channel family protein [uncultured Kushneria sp.]
MQATTGLWPLTAMRRMGAMVMLVLIMLTGVPQAHGSAAELAGLGAGGKDDAGKGEQVSPEQMRDSLDQLISTLENSEQRDSLLKGLRDLREASRARIESDNAEGASGASGRGLLGALATTFEEVTGQEGEGRSLIQSWQRRADSALEDLSGRFGEPANRWSLIRDFLLTITVQAVAALLLYLLIRAVGKYYGVTLRLPEQPTAVMLMRYCLRRLLPMGAAFAATLVITFRMGPTPGMILATTLGWAALCGMVFASVCEVVFSLFSWGHRRTALRLLRQQGAWPLFYIGSVAALGDALNASLLNEALGNALAGFSAEVVNIAAVVLTGFFVVRFRRPIRHLIRNRPLSQRQQGGVVSDLIQVLGRVWHIPALLIVAASLLAILTYSGDVRSVFARALLTAALMIVTLIVTSLLRRNSQQVQQRPRRSLYIRRLTRFGYVLCHLACWVIFAECAAQAWGFSLLNLGRTGGVGERIAQPLISIGLTVLICWLIWILTDTAIHRAMTSTSRSQRGRARRARAETITPLMRNVVFVTIVVIGSIVALANLGVNVTPLLAGAGVIGLAVGFGAQTLVQDLITGIFILVEDTLAIDDFVDVGGNLGTVEKLSLRTIRLRDLDGIVHSVPFSQIKAVQNYSREFGYALFRVRVPQRMTIDRAIEMIEETAGGMRNDPLFRFKIWSALEMQGVESFTEGSAIVRARFRTAPVMQWEVAREFNLRLKRRMDEEGFDLAVPRTSIHLENIDGLLEHLRGSRTDGPREDHDVVATPLESRNEKDDADATPDGSPPGDAPSRP